MRFAIEGEEEIGSTAPGAVGGRPRRFLKDCHGSLTLDGSVNRFTGRPQINPGWRAGILAVELHSAAPTRTCTLPKRTMCECRLAVVWALFHAQERKEES